MMTTPLPVKELNAADARNAAFAGERLRYAFAETSLGLVAATVSSRGICQVVLGQNRDLMLEEIRGRCAKANLREDTGDDNGAGSGNGVSAVDAAEAIARLIESPGAEFMVRVDVRGTAFQQAVWKALGEVPAGQTTTYAEIARRIGAPNAVRAVGAACGANRLAVVIPCHRAVASDGKLTGYRWGIEWKRALLEREAVAR